MQSSLDPKVSAAAAKIMQHVTVAHNKDAIFDHIAVGNSTLVVLVRFVL